MSGLSTTLFLRLKGSYEEGMVVGRIPAGRTSLSWSVSEQRFVVEFHARQFRHQFDEVPPVAQDIDVTVFAMCAESRYRAAMAL